eukprot:TRINITY_DN51987_c0_g1_i1.p1 TRINITY_DN51987_c0_g1~~TRINITY_DN51987_c0_g1_i1.p1  ORF type:complete len:135 (+),score=18.77 TRINITY_DN51987_c0_g1_i1:65-469(+)
MGQYVDCGLTQECRGQASSSCAGVAAPSMTSAAADAAGDCPLPCMGEPAALMDGPLSASKGGGLADSAETLSAARRAQARPDRGPLSPAGAGSSGARSVSIPAGGGEDLIRQLLAEAEKTWAEQQRQENTGAPN